MPLEFNQKRNEKVEAAARQAMRTEGADASQFVEALYQNGSAEDISRYAIDDLLACGLEAWRLLQNRNSETHSLDVSTRALTGRDGEAADPVTVINIQNDDMPFLLDSIMGELNASGHQVLLVLHPIMAVDRDSGGGLTAFHGSNGATSAAFESVIQIHIAALDDRDLLEDVRRGLDETLNDVRTVVRDWRSMRDVLKDTTSGYRTNPPPVSVNELAESVQFLEWLANNNFVFMGMREYVFVGGHQDGQLERVDTPGLGLLSDPDMRVLRKGAEMVTITPEIREFLLKPEPLIITKANLRSRVHRRVHLDYIGVKTYNEDGALKGELRVVGLFTSSAYATSAAQIPILRRKIDSVLVAAGFDSGSHSGKALINVLEFYPRDELFQLDDETLLRNALTVLELDERPRVRVLPRRDKFDRFVSILIYTPRDRYSTDVRLRIGAYLAKAYEGYVSTWFVAYPEGTLARLHLIIGRRSGTTPDIDQADLEQAVEDIIRTWNDALGVALSQHHETRTARALFARYQTCFSAAYREAYEPDIAVSDIDIIERLQGSGETYVRFGRRADQDDQTCHLKFYQSGTPIPLSDRVPILENMGFRVINERTYKLMPKSGAETPESGVVYLHDMTMKAANDAVIDLGRQKAPLEAAFMAVWLGRAENDGFNRLTLNADIGWRDVAFVRAFSRYLRQAQLPYSPDYLWDVVNRHSAIIAHLVELFHHRFQPQTNSERDLGKDAEIVTELGSQLSDVSSLDDDRILRAFLTLLDATLRTNFFQLGEDGAPKSTFAFKLKPKDIAFLPEPRPYREIFVYSTDVEGVHLRFGPVARGGLRWSDRAQDFRTEVLGLVKAQQVKNAVIVPVGAKGGFYPKKLPVGGSRDDVFAAGTAAYKTFIGALLDVTDNLVAEDIIAPENVVRYDAADPYLVVAADKGTATFSDTANAIADERGFWLSDAFASGGSAGYDHKKMGITARGAWEAVKRHFREMDHDIQTDPFTVIGVGDMSGDVFGNGMLLSPAIRLLAAFDHRDIFIDPDPNPETTFAERQRLFNLGRSSWKDYDTTLISKGGGVFSRMSKSIALTPEIKSMLEIDDDHLTPTDLMQAILKSKADLLWFGGIGTYIKASSETHADVGDKGNDSLRVSACDVQARVIGEGANLGITQLGRVEFSQSGGRCNSDAIDNSAGVNSSDVEVNIKIALGSAMRSGRLELSERNVLLADMTENVASLVLTNNYDQTLSISLTERRGAEDHGYQKRLMQSLESRGLLSRAVEELPDDVTLGEREADGQYLTRPEIGVLLAYAKIVLFDDLVSGDVPDDPYLEKELMGYFPKAMAGSYDDDMRGHRLRREIIATRVVNDLVNRGGATFVTRIQDSTGIDVHQLTRCFIVVREVFRLSKLEQAIDALDAQIPGQIQLDLYRVIQDLLHDRLAWFARNADVSGPLADVIDRYQPGTDQIASGLAVMLPSWGGGLAEAQARSWQAEGVPADLSVALALLPALADAPDIVIIGDETHRPLDEVEATFRFVGQAFKLSRLRDAARNVTIDDYFDGLALDRALQQIAVAQRRITASVLTQQPQASGEAAFVSWSQTPGVVVGRTQETIETIVDGGGLSVSKLSVVSGLLLDLASTK